MDQRVLAQLTQLYMTMKLECPFYGVNMFLLAGRQLQSCGVCRYLKYLSVNTHMLIQPAWIWL